MSNDTDHEARRYSDQEFKGFVGAKLCNIEAHLQTQNSRLNKHDDMFEKLAKITVRHASNWSVLRFIAKWVLPGGGFALVLKMVGVW